MLYILEFKIYINKHSAKFIKIDIKFKDPAHWPSE